MYYCYTWVKLNSCNIFSCALIFSECKGIINQSYTYIYIYSGVTIDLDRVGMAIEGKDYPNFEMRDVFFTNSNNLIKT